MVDAAVDAVGFEAKGHGHGAEEAPATVLNSIMEVTREAGKLGILGLYVTGDPGAKDEAAKQGSLSIRIGLGWAKSHSFTTGQCPVMRYHRQLMNAILNDRCQIAKAVNATVISLDEAPAGLPGLRQGSEPRSSSSTRTGCSATSSASAHRATAAGSDHRRVRAASGGGRASAQRSSGQRSPPATTSTSHRGWCGTVAPARRAPAHEHAAQRGHRPRVARWLSRPR